MARTTTQQAPWRAVDDGVLLLVRARPGAKRDGVGAVRLTEQGPALEVAVSQAAEKGRANKAIIAVLAKALRLPKSAIVIKNGETQRLKLLRLTGDARALAQALRALTEQ